MNQQQCDCVITNTYQTKSPTLNLFAILAATKEYLYSCREVGRAGRIALFTGRVFCRVSHRVLGRVSK